VDRIDLREYFGEAASSSLAREAAERRAAVKRGRVDFTYNAFLGVPLSNWIRSLFSKKNAAER
jgi:hypothetical protein